MLAALSGDAHDVAVGAICTLVGVGLLLVARVMWRAGKVLTRLEQYVLPHFEPPSAEEIREKVPDNTLPTRIAALEQSLTNQENALSRHLAEEVESYRALDERLSGFDERFDTIQNGQRRHGLTEGA